MPGCEGFGNMNFKFKQGPWTPTFCDDKADSSCIEEIDIAYAPFYDPMSMKEPEFSQEEIHANILLASKSPEMFMMLRKIYINIINAEEIILSEIGELLESSVHMTIEEIVE